MGHQIFMDACITLFFKGILVAGLELSAEIVDENLDYIPECLRVWTFPTALSTPVLLAESAAPRNPRNTVAPVQKKPPKNAYWSLRNENKFLLHLIAHKPAAGDGINFTKTVYVSAAVAVNEDSLERGAPKNWEACKSKFQKLRGLFTVICEIIGNSGWAWDDKRGACIDASSTGVWDAFVKHRPLAKPFRNEGWVHLASFRSLMPDSIPRGGHVYRPQNADTQLSFPSQHEDLDNDYDGRDGSQDWDIEKPVEGSGNLGDSDDERDDGDKENEPVPQTPAPPASRKRSAAEPATGTAKKLRVSSSNSRAVLEGISNQMGDFNDIFRLALGPDKAANELPSTPVRLKNATKYAREVETWMDKGKLIALLDVFENNKNAVDVYDTLKDDADLRILWVKKKVGIPIDEFDL
ncbi:hypothetical protein DFH06DRAFT_1482076 [Mycena polygramma]|nr:hypothetical protein DFH06DRAFT_1482076 [Mycena polygramma]